MNLFSLNSPIYNFVVRWLFSTNHKCGVLASLVPGAGVLYRNAVTVKPLAVHLKFSKRAKRANWVLPMLSLGKQTFIMISPIRGADLLANSSKTQWLYLNILFCGGKGQCIELNCLCFARNCAVVSQDLEETYVGHGFLRYDYKGGSASLGVHLGRYGKPMGLRNPFRNVVPLPYPKRDFSSWESHGFKKLNIYEGKYVNLTEVLADVEFLQGAYQRIKSNPGVMAKKSDDKTLDSLDANWFHVTSKRLLDGSCEE
jgi:hypothetical protein